METQDESGSATVTDIARTTAPWGRELVVQALAYDSGMRLARLRIREGHRFTMLDLDAATVEWLAAALRQALGQATAE
jgi:hypothetical protein